MNRSKLVSFLPWRRCMRPQKGGRLALALACLLITGTVNAREPQPAAVQAETLMRTGSSWDGVAYKSYPSGQPELTVLKITIAPHTSLPWHTHPMPNAAYVLSGEITVEKKENGQKKVLSAGQVLPEMVNELHRGTTGDQPVELIVFYAGTKDMPLSEH